PFEQARLFHGLDGLGAPLHARIGLPLLLFHGQPLVQTHPRLCRPPRLVGALALAQFPGHAVSAHPATPVRAGHRLPRAASRVQGRRTRKFGRGTIVACTTPGTTIWRLSFRAGPQPGCSVIAGLAELQPWQELAMIGLLDLFMIYCSSASHMCIETR